MESIQRLLKEVCQLDRTTCCVVSGGPAGMMLGLLLARAGVAVTVLEKHADFLRDFRGDTVHPSRDLDRVQLRRWAPAAAIQPEHAPAFARGTAHPG